METYRRLVCAQVKGDIEVTTDSVERTRQLHEGDVKVVGDLTELGHRRVLHRVSPHAIASRESTA